MRKHLPNWLKNCIRFIVYNNQRKKVFREIGIRREQNILLNEQHSSQAERLIVFVVSGADWFTGKDQISGGILSIASIYEETVKLAEIHKSEVIMVTEPNAHLLLRHEEFPNKINVFRFTQLQKFKNLKSVIVHVPEYMVNEKMSSALKNHLESNAMHLNILNQRYDLMPDKSRIDELKKQGWFITQTTAHDKYSTLGYKNKYGIPLHKLSVFASPEKYNFNTLHEKENIILFSPDSDSLKKDVLTNLKSKFSNFQFIEIKNMKYTDYLRLQERSKFMITFGEGLDFYFIESFFSGGIAFAIYNENFFKDSFKNAGFLFSSNQQMLDSITEKINTVLMDESLYSQMSKEGFDLCAEEYSSLKYRENLKNFYEGKYTFN